MRVNKSTHRGINVIPPQIGDIYLKPTNGVLGEPHLVRRRTSGNVNRVALAYESDHCTRIRPYGLPYSHKERESQLPSTSGNGMKICTIIGTAWGIDIEPGEDLGRRAVQTEDDLH
jgi:hypothetical protein